MKRPTRGKLRQLIKKEPEKVIDFIFELFDKIDALTSQVDKLTVKVKTLENKHKKDSHNSNNPPSSDLINKPIKSLREQSGKNPGGQIGHEGHTLEFSKKPDHIEVLPVEKCEHCGKQFNKKNVPKYNTRQVIELVIRTETVEYRAEERTCNCGKITTATFPAFAKKKVQYGLSMISFLAYINQRQIIPLDRVTEFIKDTTGHTISQGTVNNSVVKCYNELKPFEVQAKILLLKSAVVGFDATGIRCLKKNYWIHVACTSSLTLLYFHAKKSKKAMDEFGILPEFKGIAVHDFDKTYFQYLCDHSLCCAHFLRELIFLFEEEEKLWAGEMIELLIEMNEKVKSAKEKGLEKLPTRTINRLTVEYQNIIKLALKKAPLQKERVGERGRIKQTKERNLLDRLSQKQEETLRFLNDFKVPFDNNGSERSFRMAKAKQKISGCFRNPEYGKMYCRIRSYIDTVQKNGLPILESLKNALMGRPFIPVDSS